MQLSKKHRAQFLMTFLALVSMAMLAACGNGPQATGKPVAAPAGQQVYRIPFVTKDINTFDPAQVTDLNSGAAIDMVFTGLVSLNDKLQVQPQLATGWDISPDNLTYTFHLKPNLKFSDGTQLTSADVAYSIDRALSPDIYNADGISLTYLGLVKGAADRTAGNIPTVIGTGIQTPDDNTVVIHVAKKTAYFLEALAYPTSYIVEKKVIDQWKDKWTDHLSDNGGQGGNGPFVVQNYNHNTGITFVPNPKYYGKQPLLKKVVISFVKDAKTAYLEYKTNQVETAGVPSPNIAQAKTLPDHQYHQDTSLAIDYFGLNYLVKPLDNIKIRQALDLALNKDLIAHSIWNDQVISTNHIVPNGMPGYNSSLTGPDGVASTTGDTTKAKQLFQEGLQQEGLTLATFPTLKFTYANGSTDMANDVTTVLQMWQQVLGITSIKPNPVDVSTLFSDISNTTNTTSLDMWAVDWIADYPDPQDWITLQFDKGFADNNINYGQNNSSDASTQQALQPQMEAADAMTDQTARMQAYNQIEQQLVNDVAWLPMDQSVNVYVLKPYVVGVVPNAQGLTPPDDWGSIYITTH